MFYIYSISMVIGKEININISLFPLPQYLNQTQNTEIIL